MSTPAPPLVSFRDHLDALAAATERFASAASSSWMGAEVPTCPDWTMLDLVAHAGMVHRWATAAVEGDRETMGDAELIAEEGRTSPDPPAWLRAGSARLAEALEAAADDLDAYVFLAQAPPAKLFWARRQCHETTIHALDAVAARAGRALTAEDTWFGPDLAVDGIDELLVGFWQRRKSGPRSATPYAALVRATDVDAAWLLQVGPERTVTTRLDMGAAAGDDIAGALAGTVAGSAVDLYLALWNRGDDVDDPAGLVRSWRCETPILW
jgi:uncharacterized protein (TIGR03083 family)